MGVVVRWYFMCVFRRVFILMSVNGEDKEYGNRTSIFDIVAVL